MTAPGTLRTRRHRTVPALLVGTSLAMTLMTLLPATRPPAMVTACVLAAVAPLVGLWLYRPARRLPWLLLTAMLTAWAVSFAAPTTTLALDAQLVGTLVAVVVVGTLFDLDRRSPVALRARRGDRTTWGRRVDQVVVAIVLALAVAQAVRTATAAGAPPSAWWSPVDVVLACLLLRFVASRSQLGTSMQLFVGAGVLACVYDAVVANTGTHIVALPHPLNSLWALASTLFVAAAVHPSMQQAFAPGGLRRLKPESGRVLGLVPLVLVPCVLATFDPAGRLPTSAYLVTGALLAALTVSRGAQALRGSEDSARRDPLTSLANRRALQEAFDALLLSSTSGGPIGRLVALDLDDFKNVNDTYGHETGDQLLVGVGRRLAEAVGDAGTVARSGGDEFVLLLRPEAPPVADLLERAFLQSFVLDTGLSDQLFTVRASSGWVDVTPSSVLPHALADADIALYTSKGTARGTTTRFAPDQREAVLGRLALAEDLRALVCGETGAGELTLLFQPLVALADRRVLGCEALVRWAHPTRGVIAPDDFLPLAEAQGRGSAVDTWVLERACAVAADWARQGLPWTVSVNLGRSSMVDPGLEARVRSALAGTGLDPRRLHLEITEHDQLPTDAGVEALRALAGIGVQVALDDFGTGYTSLAYLQRYPVSVLKLDRSVTGVDSPTALLTGVVGLADALGISVLAEGIETDEQSARLAGLGAAQGQGWLFGRPVPADQLPVRVDPVPRPRAGLPAS